jgi:hypothetical protein
MFTVTKSDLDFCHLIIIYIHITAVVGRIAQSV